MTIAYGYTAFLQAMATIATLPVYEREIARSQVVYKSRGKGRGGVWSTSNPVSRCNNAGGKRTQKREMARRMRQIAAGQLRIAS